MLFYRRCNEYLRRTAPVTVNTQCGQQISSCSPEFTAGFGNTSENYTYTVNVASAGSYNMKINYARWEGNTTVIGSVKVNGGANQSMSFIYTGGRKTTWTQLQPSI